MVRAEKVADDEMLGAGGCGDDDGEDGCGDSSSALVAEGGKG